MNIERITDSRDWNYPFSEKLYLDATVVYHGTHSVHSALIEDKGFLPGSTALPIGDLRRLIAIADAAQFRSWPYTVVTGLSSSTRLDKPELRSVYFSPNFWFARDYSTSPGGETLHNARLLSEELVAFLSHRSSRDTVLIEEVKAIRDLLHQRFAGGFPTVYAVRVKADWLQHKSAALEREVFGGYIHLDANVACLRHVPPQNILARVDYVNGAERGYLGPAPAEWTAARTFCSPSASAIATDE